MTTLHHQTANKKMNKIHEIELRRIANALVYFAEKTENFGVTKANKLLYYLDCYHLHEYGRPVLKESYHKNDLGPVPNTTYNLLNQLLEINELPKQNRDESYTPENDSDIFSEYIFIQEECAPGEHTLRHIIAKKKFEPQWFSKSELAVLEEVFTELGCLSATALVEKTHRETPYREADFLGDINLALYLKDKNIDQTTISAAEKTIKLIKSIAHNYQ